MDHGIRIGLQNERDCISIAFVMLGNAFVLERSK